MSDETTELLHVGDILWNEPCDERIVVIAANERNVWLRKVQKNDELAMHDGHVWSMLGKKCNVKNMCTQSYAQSAFELDGHVEQAIAATLGEKPRDKTGEWLLDACNRAARDYVTQLEELVRDWQALYEHPDYGDCCRLRKRMQALGIEVIDE